MAARVGSGRTESRRHTALSRRGPNSDEVWKSAIDTYVHAVIGNLPVTQETAGHLMSVLLSIWSDKRATARRVKQRIAVERL